MTSQQEHRNKLARIRYAKLSEQERKDRNERVRTMRRLGKWINR